MRLRSRGLALTSLSLCLWAGDAGAVLGGTQPGELANGGQFADADTCSNCHGGGYAGDHTYLPFDSWAGTMMANAARDPVFFAALAIANQDVPGSGELCLRCHSPIGFVRGHAEPTDGSAFDDTDKQGVGCDTCHRALQSPAPDDPYLVGDAQMVYDEVASKHGKYEDSVSPAHQSIVDTGLLRAEFCGQCHVVRNPDRQLKDAAGVDTGLEFPLETTFLEWQASDYAKIGSSVEAGCRDCHMPKKVGDWPLTKQGGTLRTDPGQHTFVGGNHWGIRAVMEANPDRVALYPDAFELAKANTLAFLPTSVKVTIEAAPTSGAPGGSIDVTVKVDNETGHKFPTGYVDGRRAWIALTLVDGLGAERTMLGAYDDATGQIQASPATHVYRAEHGRWNGSAGVLERSLVLQDMLLVDTRIPPKGFVPTAETVIVGEIDYGDGLGGTVDYDLATFTVTLPEGAYGAQTLAARVYFQSITRDYIDYLRDANVTNEKGDELAAIYEATDRAPPLLVASAEHAIDLGPDPNAGAGGAGGASASGTGGQGGAPAAGVGGAAVTGGGTSSGASPAGGAGDGCGCRTTPREGGASPAALALAAVLALRRRRRVALRY